jgi:hypothetical protein
MKKIILSSFLFTSCFSLASAEPFGEKVNCRIQTGQQIIYGGFASCTVYDKGLIVRVSEFISSSLSNSAHIHEYVNGKFYGCWADIPYLRTDTVTTEVCDYKPLPVLGSSHIITKDEYGPERWKIINAKVHASSKDYDGFIVNQEIWVDGVKYPGPTVDLWQLGGGWNGKSDFSVLIIATDNQGYMSQKNFNISVTPQLIE